MEQHLITTLPLGGADVGLIFGDLREGGQLVHLLEAAQAVAQASSLGGDHNHRLQRQLSISIQFKSKGLARPTGCTSTFSQQINTQV